MNGVRSQYVTATSMGSANLATNNIVSMFWTPDSNPFQSFRGDDLVEQEVFE